MVSTAPDGAWSAAAGGLTGISGAVVAALGNGSTCGAGLIVTEAGGLTEAPGATVVEDAGAAVVGAAGTGAGTLPGGAYTSAPLSRVQATW